MTALCELTVIFVLLTKNNPNFLASEKGLLVVMIITALFTTIFSFQMMMSTASMGNAISLTIFFAIVRALYYIGKSMVS